MGIGETLTKEIKAWGVLAIVVVMISVVLLKFKTANVGDITCSAPNAYFNASANACCLGTDFTTVTNCASGNTSAIGDVAGTLDTFVAAFSEPKNWVAIVIIALIGFAILKLFTKKK